MSKIKVGDKVIVRGEIIEILESDLYLVRFRDPADKLELYDDEFELLEAKK